MIKNNYYLIWAMLLNVALFICLFAILERKIDYEYCIDWNENGQNYTACNTKEITIKEYLILGGRYND